MKLPDHVIQGSFLIAKKKILIESHTCRVHLNITFSTVVVIDPKVEIDWHADTCNASNNKLDTHQHVRSINVYGYY